jgi:sec-independent protein translocase protein TatB
MFPFDISWGKIVLIGIVALLVIGPKELPSVLRTLGQWTAKLRRMAAEFQSQFQEAMREAEMADLKKSVDELTGQVQSYTNFDPVADVRREFETTQRQVESAIAEQPPAETSSTPAAAATSASATTPPADPPPTVASETRPEPEPALAGATPEPGKGDAGDKSA